MFFDHRSDQLTKLRAALSSLLLPVQYVVHVPLSLFDWMQSNVSTHQQLLKENTHLQAEHLLLQAQVQKLIALEKENKKLFALLESSAQVNGKVVVAQLLAVSTEPFLDQLVVDKGSKDEVFLGQAVLDAAGVMGQVLQVAPFSSQIILITDTRSAIPIQDSRNGTRAIAVGTGSNRLKLINMPKTTDIKQGDLLMTSGLGQRYPSGYPVGKVTQVNINPGKPFAEITVRPSAHLNKSRLMLLVWPDNFTQGKTS